MADRDRNDSPDMLDEAIEETFPASDAPANTVETGIRIGTHEKESVGDDDPVPEPDTSQPR
jgi:hypothetical protein